MLLDKDNFHNVVCQRIVGQTQGTQYGLSTNCWANTRYTIWFVTGMLSGKDKVHSVVGHRYLVC